MSSLRLKKLLPAHPNNVYTYSVPSKRIETFTLKASNNCQNPQTCLAGDLHHRAVIDFLVTLHQHSTPISIPFSLV